MDLFDYPGLLPYGDGRFEILHADWPVYPAGHGWERALSGLAVFPASVRFKEVDEIDQCLLLVAVGIGSCLEPQGDLFDQRWFHVAAWRADLLELHRLGLIVGGTLVSEYEAACEYYDKFKDASIVCNGALEPLRLTAPHAADYDEEGPPVFRLASDGIGISTAGTTAAESLARALSMLHERIRVRVAPLIEIGFRDTSIREAGLILETRLRETTESESYGQALVNQYLSLLRSSRAGQASAFFKVLRGELRTIFKFIRNDFAHSLRDITEAQCNLLLDRISVALEAIEHIEQVERAGAS